MATVRPIAELDIDEVDNFEATVFGDDRWSREMIEATVAHPDTRVFVAEVEREGRSIFAGYCALYLEGPDAYVTTIGVTQTLRRSGVGRLMMRRLIESSVDLGASTMRLNLRLDNHGAKKLYESLGFKSVGIASGYYESDGADAETMELRL